MNYMITIDEVIKKTIKEDLVRVYHKIEAQVIDDLNMEAEREAFEDLVKGHIHEATSGAYLIKKCLE